MDQKTESYYQVFFDLFDTPGWKQLERETKEQREGLEAQILNAQSWDDTLYLRGRRDQLNMLENLADMFEQSYQIAKEDAEQADADS